MAERKYIKVNAEAAKKIEAVSTNEYLLGSIKYFPTRADLLSHQGKMLVQTLFTALADVRQLRVGGTSVNEQAQVQKAYDLIEQQGFLDEMAPDVRERFIYGLTESSDRIESVIASLHRGIIGWFTLKMQGSIRDRDALLAKQTDQLFETINKTDTTKGSTFISFLAQRLYWDAMNQLKSERKEESHIAIRKFGGLDIDEVNAELTDGSYEFHPEQHFLIQEESESFKRAMDNAELTTRERQMMLFWLSMPGIKIAALQRELFKEDPISASWARELWKSALVKLRNQFGIKQFLKRNLPEEEIPIQNPVTLAELDAANTSLADFFTNRRHHLYDVIKSVAGQHYRPISEAVLNRLHFSPEEIEDIDFERFLYEVQVVDKLFTTLRPAEKFALIVNAMWERTLDTQNIYTLFTIQRSTLESCFAIIDDDPDLAERFAAVTSFAMKFKEKRIDINRLQFYLWLRDQVNNDGNDGKSAEDFARMIPDEFRPPKATIDLMRIKIREAIDYLVTIEEVSTEKSNRALTLTKYQAKIMQEYIAQNPGKQITIEELSQLLVEDQVPLYDERAIRKVLELVDEQMREQAKPHFKKVADLKVAIERFMQETYQAEGAYPKRRIIVQQMVQEGFGTEEEVTSQVKGIFDRYPLERTKKVRAALTEAETQQILDLLASGLNANEVGQKVNVDPNTVRRIRRTHAKAEENFQE